MKDIENQTPLGELVELVDKRNSEDKVKTLLGINVNKVFMPSKANVTKNNLPKYKIIQKGQFAYSEVYPIVKTKKRSI
ncbi:MAG: hypothetical protein U9Q89_07175 [Thermodesulfobacteriota bacterium]|nr:hypothetical protein [Thermodesulfobacteriota bacterium]